jgi:hypothetical protein
MIGVVATAASCALTAGFASPDDNTIEIIQDASGHRGQAGSGRTRRQELR